MKILFSGGGTLGPVTPLLAIHDVIKEEYENASFVWVGTKKGPEKVLVQKKGIKFKTITAGKLRRYLSLWNIFDFFKIIIGFFQAIIIIWKENPDVCISAGGFISVPVHWAAWLYGTKTWIHQQDVRVGLANKLMSPVASQVTVAVEENIKKFPKRKVFWLGNPVRKEILQGSRERAIEKFKLNPKLPTVFATGGGTGSLRVNQMIVEAVNHLKGVCQVIHLSGKERPQELVERAEKHFDYYQVHQFFNEEMKDAYMIADIVISRGGFGTLTEIAALKKPAILIPKPGHQEENVGFLADVKAVILVDERTGSGNLLAGKIKDLLQDKTKAKKMGDLVNKMLPVASRERIVEILEGLVD